MQPAGPFPHEESGAYRDDDCALDFHSDNEDSFTGKAAILLKIGGCTAGCIRVGGKENCRLARFFSFPFLKQAHFITAAPDELFLAHNRAVKS
jgi:hypothetical protein